MRKNVGRQKAQLLRERAAAMRAAPTLSELALWELLKGSRLGVAFRRQVVVGGYITDFCAPSIKLIAEVDGGYHTERQNQDQRRDQRLERLGYRVVRVGHREVLEMPEAAQRSIRLALTCGQSPLP